MTIAERPPDNPPTAELPADLIDTSAPAPSRFGRLIAPLFRHVVSGPSRSVGVYRRELATRATDRHALVAVQRRNQWAPLWRDAAEGTGLHEVVVVAAGQTSVIPRLVSVVDDPPDPVALLVECRPGQLLADFRAVADRLAPPLGAERVRITPRGNRHVRIDLLEADPLREDFHAELPPIAQATDQIILGRDEDGITIGHAPADAIHVLAQGETRSGKSRWSYGVLQQCAHAPDILVTGCDHTGLLLGRPWEGTRHREWQCDGADWDAHAALLERLVDEMQRRLATIPPRVDKIEPCPETPAMLVVLEEYPGLLRGAAGEPKPARGERSVGDRIKRSVLRLLSEGAKVGFRVIMLAQRAEAEAVGGGYARDQFGLIVSFRVPADSLAMAHGEAGREWGAEHQTAPTGVALVSAPGRPITRMRSPYVEDYAGYVDCIGGAS